MNDLPHAAEGGTILVVDDEPEVLASVRRQLRREFKVLTADNAEQALELLREHPVQVIVSDQRMPDVSGVELLAQVRTNYPKTMRIMLTGYADLKAVIGAVNSGQIFRYITKPWEPDEIRTIVRDASERSRLMAENERLIGALRRANQELEMRVAERTLELTASEQRYRSIVESTRDPVMLLDTNALIIAINPAFTHVTGFTQEECVGKSPSILSSGRHPPKFFNALRRQLDSDGVWRGLIWNRRKDGGIYIQRMSVTLAQTPSDEIANYVCVYTDPDYESEELEQLWIDAQHDPLTGLPSQSLLLDRLDWAVKHASRHELKLAVLFLDLDGFKPVNDTYGHAVGDQVLQTVGQRIRQGLRESDIVARVGGDEFVILLRDIADGEGLNRVTQKLVDEVQMPIETEQATVQVEVSVGLAIFPDDATDAKALLALADTTMYGNKRERRNGRENDSSPRK
jgi:diguanylate cyclase (GGDEF)-like protein/PAS domain S-box-containing protein